MKRTALLAVAAFLLVAGPATAAPKAVKGIVVAKHAQRGTIVLATGLGLGVLGSWVSVRTYLIR